MPGPAPKPSNLRILQGMAGHRPLPKDEPQPEQVSIDESPPKGLTTPARKVWRDMLPRLTGMRVLTVADIPALINLCEARAEELFCNEQLTADGWIDGNNTSPWVRIRKDARARHDSLLKEFGCTPSARTKVKTVAATKKVNPFD